jgi:hypothetical protein
VVEANHLPLVDYQPYYQDYILYRFEDGVCDLATQYSFTTTDQGPAVKLSAFNLALASLRLRKPGEDEDFLRAKTAQIKDASVDVRALVLNVGQFTTRGGFLNVIREADGGLNATRILPAPKEAAPAGQQGTPWLVTLQRADAQKWKVAFTDLTLQEPVRIVADDVTLKAAGVSNQKGRNGRIELSARLNETGTLAVSGPLALNPVRADLKLDLKDFGLVPLQPYFADRVNVLITSADLSATGQTSFAVPPQGQASVAFDGEVALTNFASVDKATSEDFLKWNILVAGSTTPCGLPSSRWRCPTSTRASSFIPKAGSICRTSWPARQRRPRRQQSSRRPSPLPRLRPDEAARRQRSPRRPKPCPQRRGRPRCNRPRRPGRSPSASER